MTNGKGRLVLREHAIDLAGSWCVSPVNKECLELRKGALSIPA